MDPRWIQLKTSLQGVLGLTPGAPLRFYSLTVTSTFRLQSNVSKTDGIFGNVFQPHFQIKLTSKFNFKSKLRFKSKKLSLTLITDSIKIHQLQHFPEFLTFDR